MVERLRRRGGARRREAGCRLLTCPSAVTEATAEVRRYKLEHGQAYAGRGTGHLLRPHRQ